MSVEERKTAGDREKGTVGLYHLRKTGEMSRSRGESLRSSKSKVVIGARGIRELGGEVGAELGALGGRVCRKIVGREGGGVKKRQSDFKGEGKRGAWGRGKMRVSQIKRSMQRRRLGLVVSCRWSWGRKGVTVRGGVRGLCSAISLPEGALLRSEIFERSG